MLMIIIGHGTTEQVEHRHGRDKKHLQISFHYQEWIYAISLT